MDRNGRIYATSQQILLRFLGLLVGFLGLCGFCLGSSCFTRIDLGQLILDLDQQLICRELGVSRALLYNKMKAITGTGAKEYITRIRIEKAKNLIETTNLSIADISEMTGFSAQSYFSTAFKNYTGLTPTKYKQQLKETKTE